MRSYHDYEDIISINQTKNKYGVVGAWSDSSAQPTLGITNNVSEHKTSRKIWAKQNDSHSNVNLISTIDLTTSMHSSNTRYNNTKRHWQKKFDSRRNKQRTRVWYMHIAIMMQAFTTSTSQFICLWLKRCSRHSHSGLKETHDLQTASTRGERYCCKARRKDGGPSTEKLPF